MWAVIDEKSGRHSVFADLRSAREVAAEWFKRNADSRVFVGRVKQDMLPELVAPSDACA